MTKYVLLLPEALVVAGAVLILLLARFGPSRYRRWRTSLPAFAVLILILVFRPAGILGKLQVEKV